MNEVSRNSPEHNTRQSSPCPLPPTDYGALSGYNGPRGFHWLIRGCLAGMSRPGLLYPIHSDLQGLVRMGIDVLVTLTEEWVPDADAIAREGLKSYFVPIPDMHPPSIEQANDICGIIADHIAQGQRIVYHCRAGRGRTGTLLAAQMIWHGKSADEAIAYTKKRNPLWIESEAQIDFLKKFNKNNIT